MNMLIKISAAAVAFVTVATLSGCAGPSGEQKSACYASGGNTTSFDILYEGSESDFFKTTTGDIDVCQQPDGNITAVYNEEVVQLDNIWWSRPSDDNRRVFEVCKRANDKVYKTSQLVGKFSYTYYVCYDGSELYSPLVEK